MKLIKNRVWVRRDNRSPTSVAIKDDDLVDDVKSAILVKYSNSLGKMYDSDEIILKLTLPSSENRAVQLRAEDEIRSVLNQYYPHGQTYNEALQICVNPKGAILNSPYLASPSMPIDGNCYFTDKRRQSKISVSGAASEGNTTPSIRENMWPKNQDNKKYSTRSSSWNIEPQELDKTGNEHANEKSDVAEFSKSLINRVSNLLEDLVPPIKVLLVEDNIVNLKILVAFLKKKRIQCNVARNGKEAVEKWKQGLYHLVLMDIQLPVMSGIEAAKEIRRLERLNGLGVFKAAENENIQDVDFIKDNVFKSPVIIVALTASSLLSDRNEALAAGCNDFLTKPVSLVWLENKVREWGFMQSLIDYEGWNSYRRHVNSGQDLFP